jgi:hypothetical protein
MKVKCLHGKTYWESAAALRGHREWVQCAALPLISYTWNTPEVGWYLDKTLCTQCITTDCTFWGTWEKSLRMWIGEGWQVGSTNSRDLRSTNTPFPAPITNADIGLWLSVAFNGMKTQTQRGGGRARAIENLQISCNIYDCCCWNCDVHLLLILLTVVLSLYIPTVVLHSHSSISL